LYGYRIPNREIKSQTEVLFADRPALLALRAQARLHA
jgi:hypothetical protein